MADYYYVDSTVDTNGLGNSYTTDQTGSFSTLSDTNVYGTIAQAITDGASDGDVICVSTDHAFDEDTEATITYTGGTTTPLTIISVSSSNCDTYTKASSIQEQITTAGGDVRFSKFLVCIGISIASIDDFIGYTSGTHAIFTESTLAFTDSLGRWNATSDGLYFEFNNCTIDFDYGTGSFFLIYGVLIVINGGELIYSTSNTSSRLASQASYGGGSIILNSVDLSNIISNIVDGTGSSSINDDNIFVTLNGCKLNAAVGMAEETFTCSGHKMLVTQSSSSSTAAEYQYFYKTRGGTVEDNTTFYRDDSTAFEDSSQKVSLKAVTDTNATPAQPFVFEMPSRFAELENTAKDTIRIYFISSSTLDDLDVWVDVSYPDGTNKHEFNTITSLGSSVIPQNPLRSAGSTVVANTDTWTGRTTENRYQIDIDTSSNAGRDCVPLIKVYIAKASAIIYFDTTIGTV